MQQALRFRFRECAVLRQVGHQAPYSRYIHSTGRWFPVTFNPAFAENKLVVYVSVPNKAVLL
jgi:hypothetical protein